MSMIDEKQVQPCPGCEGKGYLSLENPKYCSVCYGTGRKDAPKPADKKASDIVWAKRVSAIIAKGNG